MSIDQILDQLRLGFRSQRALSTEHKNQALMDLAQALEAKSLEILKANEKDLNQLSPDRPPAFRDRLELNGVRLRQMAESLRQVAMQPDPVGELFSEKTLANGLRLKQVRAPLGVIFMIFESRPNVILEAFSLAFKSGNTILLRGGSESKTTASAIYHLMQESLNKSGLKHTAFHGLQDYDRSLVEQLLKRPDRIDVAVPRGGEALIQFVQSQALMPIIKNDRGMCHTYVDSEADTKMATQIVANAKTQRPGVCNAVETVLVHEEIASDFLPKLYEYTKDKNLEWHVDARAHKVLKNLPRVHDAKASDWDTEYLDLVINCAVVKDLDEALTHIERHGSRHSEAIVTRNETKARHFQESVDAAAVYWNASTRFTDGFEFGLGGELGISTQKLHVRGPVGLRELTTPRWIVDGNGQIRV